MILKSFLITILAAYSYMRGRLSCDAINVAIDELNKVLQVKYTLLQAPRNKLSDRARQKIDSYAAQDIPAVRGSLKHLNLNCFRTVLGWSAGVSIMECSG